MMILISVALLVFVNDLQEVDAAILWTEPIGGTGTYAFDESIATGAADVNKIIAATGTGTLTYTLLTSGTPFSIDSGTGVLSLDTTLDFETLALYTIEIQAFNGDDSSSATATVTITVNDVNEADPVFSTTYSPCIVDGSTQDTTLTTVEATDADTANTIEYSITGGNSGNPFKIDSSTGVIQVNTGTTLDKTTTASYDLVVEAKDDLATIRTSTTTVSATVADSCASGSVAVAVSMVTLLVALSATMF